MVARGVGDRPRPRRGAGDRGVAAGSPRARLPTRQAAGRRHRRREHGRHRRDLRRSRRQRRPAHGGARPPGYRRTRQGGGAQPGAAALRARAPGRLRRGRAPSRERASLARWRADERPLHRGRRQAREGEPVGGLPQPPHGPRVHDLPVDVPGGAQPALRDRAPDGHELRHPRGRRSQARRLGRGRTDRGSGALGAPPRGGVPDRVRPRGGRRRSGSRSTCGLDAPAHPLAARQLLRPAPRHRAGAPLATTPRGRSRRRAHVVLRHLSRRCRRVAGDLPRRIGGRAVHAGGDPATGPLAARVRGVPRDDPARRGARAERFLAHAARSDGHVSRLLPAVAGRVRPRARGLRSSEGGTSNGRRRPTSLGSPASSAAGARGGGDPPRGGEARAGRADRTAPGGRRPQARRLGATRSGDAQGARPFRASHRRGDRTLRARAEPRRHHDEHARRVRGRAGSACSPTSSSSRATRRPHSPQRWPPSTPRSRSRTSRPGSVPTTSPSRSPRR